MHSQAVWIEMNQWTNTYGIHPEQYGYRVPRVQAAIVGDENKAVPCSSERQRASRIVIWATIEVHALESRWRIHVTAHVTIP